MPEQSEKQNLSRSALRRMREREQRYQTILKAAEAMFAREGYHKASMEKIADMAEVSVGAVYFYFKNKEDLLVHLLDEIGKRLRRILGEAFRKYGSDMEGFRQAGYSFFEEFCMKYPHEVAIVFRESVGQGSEVEAKRKEIFDKLTSDVKNALLMACKNQNVKLRSKSAAEVITVSILGIYERVAYHYMFWQDKNVDLKAIGRDAVEFLVGGVKNLFLENGAE